MCGTRHRQRTTAVLPYSFNPQCACTVRVTVLGQCSCICLSTAILALYRLQGSLWVIPVALEQREHENKRLCSRDNGVKTSKYVNCLPQPALARRAWQRLKVTHETFPPQGMLYPQGPQAKYCMLQDATPKLKQKAHTVMLISHAWPMLWAPK